MINNPIKQDYSAEIAGFIKNGGVIQPAINTNKAEFNYCNADTVLKSDERPNSHQNHILRTRAEKQGLKSYTPNVPCKSCSTVEWDIFFNECWQGPFDTKSGCIKLLEECIAEKREEAQEQVG